MSDFSTLLRGYVTEQTDRAQAVALDPAAEARVVAWRARRRRAARVGVIAGAAAAVVIVAGAGVFAATRPEPVPPAETHTPTVTPTPSESPTDDATEEPAVDAGAGVNPLLPESQPLEPGMLAAAPPGSFLVDYQVGCGYPCLQAASEVVLHLVTPDGGVYASTLPHPQGFVTDWLPGTSVGVFATETYEGGYQELTAVDLDSGRTLGTVTNEGAAFIVDPEHMLRHRWVPELEGYVLERVALADGAVVASVGSPMGAIRLSPDRSTVMLTSSSGIRLVDTVSLAEVTVSRVEGMYGQPCEGIGWASDDAIVVGCPDPDGTRVLRVPISGGTAAEVGLHPYGAPYYLTEVWSIGGRLVLTPGAGSGDLYTSDEIAGAPIDLRFAVSNGGGRLRNTILDWNATTWSRDSGIWFVGARSDGVLAVSAPPGSDSQAVVVIDPLTGSLVTTALQPKGDGWGTVYGIAVPMFEGGQ